MAPVGRSLPQDDDDLPARVDSAPGRGRGERAEASPERLLVELRELATDGRRPLRAAGRGKLRQGRRQPARRLEQHRGAPVRGEAFQPFPALPPAARQEALEAPPRARDAGGDERCQDRRGTRDRHDVPPSAAQAATRPAPGSETSGVPASVTSARSRPARRWARSAGRVASSLRAWWGTRWVVIS